MEGSYLTAVSVTQRRLLTQLFVRSVGRMILAMGELIPSRQNLSSSVYLSQIPTLTGLGFNAILPVQNPGYEKSERVLDILTF
jgi:hypothetical protein